MPKIYTKTGDKGQTSLVSGTRVRKDAQRIELYGNIDELNSFIGLLYSLIMEDKNWSETSCFIKKIQNNLFNLGSLMACEAEKWEQYGLETLTNESVREVETQIDKIQEKLEPLKNFILPTGDLKASYAHVCRSVTRRVERCMHRFITENSHEIIPNEIVLFINRLSDYFFVLSRYFNMKEGREESLWAK